MEKKIENEEMRFGDLETEKRIANNIHLFAGFSLSEEASKKIAEEIHKAGTVKVSLSCEEELNMFSLIDLKLLEIIFSLMFRKDLFFEDAFKIASEKSKKLLEILREIEIYDVFTIPMAGEDFTISSNLRQCLSEYGVDILTDRFSQDTEIKELIYKLYLEDILEAQSQAMIRDGVKPEFAEHLLECSVAKMGEEAKELVQQALISIVIENSIEKNMKISSLMEKAKKNITSDIIYNKLLEIYKWRECNIHIINDMMLSSLMP